MSWLMQYLPALLLVFCRMTAFITAAPVFSSRNIPTPVKAGFAAFITFIVFSLHGTSEIVVMDDLFLLSIIREVLVGIALGYIASLFFAALQIAGSFVDMQMGFGIANVIDPMTGMQAPVIGNLKYMIAILLFFSFNGHHYLLQAIMSSYEWIPLHNDLFTRMYSGQISTFMLETFGRIFMISFQIAAPLVVAMFLTDLGLGLLARVSPQFNIFVIGLPLKILLGFIILILLFPTFDSLFMSIIESMLKSIEQFFSLFANG